MENNKLMPLSEYERTEAEKNHGLVFSYLHRHGFSVDDFYSVVVFGYLKGIQIYNRRADLRKYQLAFICERYMGAEVGNFYRMENSKKRKPMEKIISLDANYVEAENLYNCVRRNILEDEIMENELLHELMEKLTTVQRKIVLLKIEGYENREIIMLLEIPSSTYYKELQKIRFVLEKVVG